MTRITIKTNVTGDFTVDDMGIRSNGPVPIISDSWDPDTHILTLEPLKSNFKETSSEIVMGRANICLDGAYVGGGIITNGTITRTPTKSYRRYWAEFELDGPKLGDFMLEGSGIYKICMQLDEDCNLFCKGTGEINVIGDHDSDLSASVKGSGSIEGSGKFNSVTARVNGTGSVSGFKVIKKATGRVKGAGEVKLYRLPGCEKSKHVSGSGDVIIN